MQPLILNIHRLATDDGPGLRSTVFMKGCPLACDWCHNPEAMRPEAEIAFHPSRCITCRACADVCPEAAITRENGIQVRRSRCTACGLCVEACPTTALHRVGAFFSPADLVGLLLRDRVFFHVSGGGVTFSGGEPTLHMDYLEDVLVRLRRQDIPAAIQTCGYFPAEPFIERILPLLDWVFFDLKIFDHVRHRRFTGRDNGLILDTFRRLTRQARAKIIPRIPLVPARTATRGNLKAWARFLQELGYARCDLLPYNPSGIGKRSALGMPPSNLLAIPMQPKTETGLRALFTRAFTGKRLQLQQGGTPCKSTFIMQ